MGLSSREKDRLWKLHKESRQFVRDNYCTKNELWKPTEHNIRKCMGEIQSTRNIAEPLKEAGRLLGENTNLEKYRR